MRLEKVPSGCKVFIDTNIFLYDIAGHPVYGGSCKRFLKRLEIREIVGVTSVVVLNELLHKLILGEVSKRKGLTLSQGMEYIKKNPDVISSLKAYNIVGKIEGMGSLAIMELTPDIFAFARGYMIKYKLMSNDAIHVATCKEHEIENIATNDADFERVGFLKVWKP